MPKPRYRSFCYTDWVAEFIVTVEPMEPWCVERMVDEVADGGADAFMINPNGQRVVTPSKVWQPMWDGMDPADRATYGSVPDAEVAGHRHMLEQMARLPLQGCDFLAYALARCRKRGIAPGVSIRMNDMHGPGYGRCYLVSDFYWSHPELRVNPARNSTLNYARPEVQDYFLALIREIVEEYDVEVLDLDFMRSMPYFPSEEADDGPDIMTGFLRRARGVIRKSGKPVTLMARVPGAPATALAQGFDVAAWARERLVDGLVLSAFLHSGWEIPVAEFRPLVNEDVALYASSDFFADTRAGLPERVMPLYAVLMRGFAAGHLAGGADGIYWFNFGPAREPGVFAETPKYRDEVGRPCFEAIGEANSLDGLRGLPKTYAVMAATLHRHPTDPPTQVPAIIEYDEERLFRILLASEPEGARAAVAAVFTAEEPGAALRLVSLNGVPIGSAGSVIDEPASAHTALFPVPATLLRDGRSEIVLRSDGPAVQVVALEVRVNQ